jgi:hypothetical protein
MTFRIIAKPLKSYLFVYLVISLWFSLIVFVRVAFALNMGVINVFFYDVYYYVMPSIATIAVLVLVRKPKSEKRSEWRRFESVVAWIASIVAVSFLSLSSCRFMP